VCALSAARRCHHRTCMALRPRRKLLTLRHPCPHLRRDLAHPMPPLHRDWAHPFNIATGGYRVHSTALPASPLWLVCAGTGLTACHTLHRNSTSAPGLCSPRPHLRRDWARPFHICTGTGLTPPTSAPGPGAPLRLLLAAPGLPGAYAGSWVRCAQVAGLSIRRDDEHRGPRRRLDHAR
jgi:hypothetical protein